MKNYVRASAIAAGLALAACAHEGHISQPFDLSKNESLSIDAQQRVITNVALPPGQERTRVVCAEPSPDVMTAVAKSLGASLAAQVTPPTGGPAVEARGEFARSYAQKLSQLGERTNTIQLLRDSLYRACEAYANGAITKTTYALLLSRYDSLAVTLAMGELAAGAFGRPLATAAVGATGAATVGQGERPSLGGATAATPVPDDGPGIAGASRGDTEIARTLLLMQEAYLFNNSGLDLGPIVATCVTALAEPDEKARPSPYTRWCETLFAQIGPMIAAALPTMIRDSGALQRQLLTIESERVARRGNRGGAAPIARPPGPPPAR